jgi:Tfp pilus assembly protein PilF
MNLRFSSVAVTLLIIFISGCSSQALLELHFDKIAMRKAEQDLSKGIRNYEEGDYKTAATFFQSALDNKLMFRKDEVAAHKYLAFIHCVSNREKLCREEFRKALELDPNMELTANESGHPIWSPVFRSVKAAEATKKPKANASVTPKTDCKCSE